MTRYVILDEANCVQQVHSIDTGLPNTVAISDDQVAAVQGCYLVEGIFVPRPKIEPLLDGANIVFPPLPLGTKIYITDRIEGGAVLSMTTETEAWSGPIALSPLGSYAVCLQPPRPYLTTNAVIHTEE